MLASHRLLGQGGAADVIVWNLAREHGLSARPGKDGDFHRLALLQGAPPKFIWIRLGNCATDDIAQLLRRHHDDIVRFTNRRWSIAGPLTT